MIYNNFDKSHHYLLFQCKYQKVFEKGTFLSRKHSCYGNTHKEVFESYKTSYPEAGIYSLSMGGVTIGQPGLYSLSHQTKAKKIQSVKQNLKEFLKGRKRHQKWHHISGTVLYLSMDGLEKNFYHFFVELYAKYFIFLRAKVNVDHYIVPICLPFQQELWRIVGIDDKKILRLEENTSVYADTLVFPSSIGNYEKIKQYGYTRYNKQWLPSWLAESYKYILDNTPKINYKFSDRVYISRSFANYRRVVNEADVVELLTEHGFDCVHLEMMTLVEQINLFRNAQYVIAPHGAGLVNMSWCPSNASILEVYPSCYSDPGMRIQADLLSLDYSFIRSQFDTECSGDPRKMDLEIDTGQLRNWLKLKNII